jgi:DNA-binding PadR family transcriptional regulator
MQELKKGSLGMLALQLLHEHPDYGYQLCVRLRERSAGAISFEDAAVYPLLHDYERRGLLDGYWESASGEGSAPESSRKGPRRRYYRVTPAGMAALRASIAEWNSFAQGVARILGDSSVSMSGD